MDFYVILGVGREASPSEVKRAYKRLARRYHPDINPGDQEAAAFFRRATEAYETLSDPGRRQEYNVHGTAVPVTLVKAGPCVVVPFDTMRRDWIAKPHDAETDARVAAQQLKLLCAGYVKAGYHVVVHGDALAGGDAREGLLRLMRMVPGVYALAVGVGLESGADMGGDVPVELALSGRQSVDAIAQAVWEALLLEAVSGLPDA